jgi:hypothetical protein
MKEEKSVAVTVAPGRTVYHGGGVHGFVAGQMLPLPASHADELQEAGHVEKVAAADDQPEG